MFISVVTNDELGSHVRSEEAERARARGLLPGASFNLMRLKGISNPQTTGGLRLSERLRPAAGSSPSPRRRRLCSS